MKPGGLIALAFMLIGVSLSVGVVGLSIGPSGGGAAFCYAIMVVLLCAGEWTVGFYMGTHRRSHPPEPRQ